MLALQPQPQNISPPTPPPPLPSHHISKYNSQTGGGIEEELSRELSKVSNFVTHFLQMVEHYLGKEEERVSRRLKRGWRWIKEVVCEWEDNRNIKQTY